MRTSIKSLIYVFLVPIVCIIICLLFYSISESMMYRVCKYDSRMMAYNNLFCGLPVSDITCYILDLFEYESSDTNKLQFVMWTLNGAFIIFAAIILVVSYIYFQTVYLALVYHFSKENVERTIFFTECFKFKKYTMDIVYSENKIISFVVLTIGAIGYITICILFENINAVVYTILDNYSITVSVFSIKAMYDFLCKYDRRQTTQEISEYIQIVSIREQINDTK